MSEKKIIIGLTLATVVISAIVLTVAFSTYGIDPHHVYFSFF